MTINPNDPWYPSPYKEGENCPHMSEKGTGGCPACRGVTIRLKLAAMAMSALIVDNLPVWDAISADAFTMADAMIERANDEGKAG